MSTSTLPHQDTIAEVLKSLETETTALFEYLDLGFLLEFPVFAPDPRGRKRVFEHPELFRGLLHCFYNGIYAPQAMEQELANDDVWPVCGFDCPPSRRTIGRFIDDLSGIVEEVFSRILRQVLVRVELGTCFRIDGTDVRAPRPDEDASWNYDSTAEEKPVIERVSRSGQRLVKGRHIPRRVETSMKSIRRPVKHAEDQCSTRPQEATGESASEFVVDYDVHRTP